jgi:hypothetical protein
MSEILASHRLDVAMWLGTGQEYLCICGVRSGSHDVHQSMELANAGYGDVRAARAGALEDAADIAGRPENRWWAEGQNRAKWLRNLAAAVRGEG